MPSATGRVLFGILCLAVGLHSAHAQGAMRWLSLDSGVPTIDLDSTTITKGTSGFPRIWLRFDFKTPHGPAGKQYVSMKWRVDVNCAKRQTNMVELVQYNENGDVVTDDKQLFPSWEEVVPETVGETAVNGFCKSKFGR